MDGALARAIAAAALLLVALPAQAEGDGARRPCATCSSRR